MDTDQNQVPPGQSDDHDAEPIPDSIIPQEPLPKARANNMIGAGIAIGAGLGVALGLVFDNLALGIGIGVAIGVALGAGLNARNGTAEDAARLRGRPVFIALLIGGLVLLLGIALLSFLLSRY